MYFFSSCPTSHLKIQTNTDAATYHPSNEYKVKSFLNFKFVFSARLVLQDENNRDRNRMKLVSKARDGVTTFFYKCVASTLSAKDFIQVCFLLNLVHHFIFIETILFVDLNHGGEWITSFTFYACDSAIISDTLAVPNSNIQFSFDFFFKLDMNILVRYSCGHQSRVDTELWGRPLVGGCPDTQ